MNTHRLMSTGVSRAHVDAFSTPRSHAKPIHVPHEMSSVACWLKRSGSRAAVSLLESVKTRQDGMETKKRGRSIMPSLPCLRTGPYTMFGLLSPGRRRYRRTRWYLQMSRKYLHQHCMKVDDWLRRAGFAHCLEWADRSVDGVTVRDRCYNMFQLRAYICRY